MTIMTNSEFVARALDLRDDDTSKKAAALLRDWIDYHSAQYNDMMRYRGALERIRDEWDRYTADELAVIASAALEGQSDESA